MSTNLRGGLREGRPRPPRRPPTRGRRSGGAGVGNFGQVPPPLSHRPASQHSRSLACQSSNRRHPRTRLPRHHGQPPVHSTHRPASPCHARRPSADRRRAVCEADFACLLSTPVEAPAPAHCEPARRAQMCLRHGQAGFRGSADPLKAYGAEYHVGIFVEQVGRFAAHACP